MFSSLRSSALSLLLIPLLLSAAGDSVQTALVSIDLQGIPLRVELAVSESERRQGLMYRRSLPADQGMLFVWPQSRLRQIWMLNTWMPLDVAFFDDQGLLINRISMQPDGGRKIHRSAAPARYALEMNMGWFERRRIGPGARMSLQAELPDQRP